VHQTGPVISKHGLDILGSKGSGNVSYGLGNLGSVHWNLSVPALYEHAIRRGEGVLGKGGALCVLTGVHTGRSPNDKFFVREPSSERHIDWGKTNRAIEPAKFEGLLARMLAYAQRRELFVRECYAGADPAHRIGVRVITENAWHNLFAMNMFLRPPVEDLAEFTRKLEAKGYKLSDGPTPTGSGSTIAFIDAPEGYEVELIQRAK